MCVHVRLCTLANVREVIVAVGGGGDAITSAALARLLDLTEPPIVLTYSWDRLLIDPLPGPRRAADFDQLTELSPNVFQITGHTTPRPPAGSSLPRLAAELPAIVILLDPSNGAVGMADQISATADHFRADHLIAVDVGGDAITNGHDPGLRSPLADQLAMAACLRTRLPTTLLIAAAGIDGELSPDTIAARLDTVGARRLGSLNASDSKTVQAVLQWHPSEASGLLAAASIGMRGIVEIRDAADQVQMTNDTVIVHSLDLARLKPLSPAARLTDTLTLDQADAAIIAATGRSELRYETAKAEKRKTTPAHMPTPIDLPTIDALAAEAAQRGSDLISMRRLAELTGAISLDTYAGLTRLLQEQRPHHYAIGAYRVRGGPYD